MSVQAQDVQLYVRKPQVQIAGLNPISTINVAPFDPVVGLQVLKEQESLGTLLASFSGDQGVLVSYPNCMTSLIFLQKRKKKRV